MNLPGLKIEVARDEGGVYVRVREGEWARSEAPPGELVTIDYDKDGNVLGVEISPVQRA